MSVRPVDLLVIGGGITGLGVARLAARNGIGVVVIERGDLASGTSSVSSHMLHGGLRYLERAHLGLVRQSLAERTAVSRMAPQLARPRRFVVPVYRGCSLPLWKLRTGLALYDLLAGERGLAPHSMARARETSAIEPTLSTEGLRGAGLYSDVVMDDGRLAVLVARDATDHGAELHTHTEVIAARPGLDGTVHVTASDALSGRLRAFEARVVVNATGPWADAMRTLLLRGLHPAAPTPPPLLRPSRGIHLVYPQLTRGHGVLLVARRDRRVMFVVPISGRSLVGTTEIEVPSPPPPEAFLPTAEEVAYLRTEIAAALPGSAKLRPVAVIAGVRPLLASSATVGRASREHRVIEDGPVLTIAGGKYTTFRVMARDTLARAMPLLGQRGGAARDSDEPLPPPLAEGHTLEQAVDFAVDSEHARRVDDILRRRTSLWLDPAVARTMAPRIAAHMARRLGWDAARERAETQVAIAARDAEQELLARCMEGA